MADRIKQTNADLRAALIEQVSLMVHFCAKYDDGNLAFAKPMATSLRVILHQGGRSHSLLQQLGLRSGRFYSAPGRQGPNVVPIGCSLTPMAFTPERGGHYAPLLAPPDARSRLPFPEWWTRPVLRAPTGEKMSRMDIVTAVANTDGGAHVDSGLEPLYAAFRSGRLLGMRVFPTENGQIRMSIPILLSKEQVANDEDPRDGLLTSPQYPSVRTVTHEVLLTLEKCAAWTFSTPYKPDMDAPRG